MDSLTVLIPTHGRPTLLRRTLDSLAECEQPAGYIETIVIENGLKAGSEDVVTEASAAHPHLRLRYMHVERANKSHALNRAIATVRNGLVVFFDDDVRMDPGVLVAYAKAASDYTKDAYFGGPFSIDYEKRPKEWIIPLFPRSAKGMKLVDNVLPDEYLGCNWAVRSADLKSAGGFDPAYGPGSPTGSVGQESDMQRRLRQQGIEPYNVIQAQVWHYVPESRSSMRWLAKRMYRVGIRQGRIAGRMAAGEVILSVTRDCALNSARFVKYGVRRDFTKSIGSLVRFFSIVGFVVGQVDLRRRE